MQNSVDTTNPSITVRSWVELYSDKMYSWAKHKTSSHEAAEDLVQETFLAALQAFEKFKSDSSPKTWLFAILNNKIIDYHRENFKKPTVNENSIYKELFDENDRWKKEQRPEPWEEDSPHLLDDPDFRVTMEQCMEKLPPKWFSSVQLRFLEQKKGEEICQDLDISPTNFWQILHRAKLQLRKCLELGWFKR